MNDCIGNVSRRGFLYGSAAYSLMGRGQAFEISASQSSPVKPQYRCDVLVCGATPGGIAAAVAAARHGRGVILVEYEDHMGGIVSNGLTNTDLTPAHRNAVGGFFNEFTSKVVHHYRTLDEGEATKSFEKSCRNGFAYEPSVAEAMFGELTAKEATHLKILFQLELKEVHKIGNKMKGATFVPRDHAGHNVHIDAAVTVDATYEGDVAGMAGAEFKLGRESRQELGEAHAGVIYMRFGNQDPQPGSTGAGDKAIESYCFRFSATADPSLKIPVERPAGYNRGDYTALLDDIRAGKILLLQHVFGIYSMPNNKVEFNSSHPLPTTGVPSESLDLAEICWEWPLATQTRRRAIYQRYLTHNVGMLWMLQNDPELPLPLRQDAMRYGWCKDEFINNHHLPRQVYVREGRRIVGDYMLTEHDGELAPGFDRTMPQPTSVGVVEWAYDSHACHVFDPAHPGVREGYTFVNHPFFQIPYGVLVPKVIDGLLVPVACSCSHVAYNALRMEPVFMALGETCGEAAHIALHDKVELRAISPDRLQQALLRNGGVLTYFEDLDQTSAVFAAMQWMGARGFHKGYRADVGEMLSRRQGAEHVARVFKTWNADTTWVENVSEGPLIAQDVITWLQTVVRSRIQPSFNFTVPNSEKALTRGELAVILYRAFAPETLA